MLTSKKKNKSNSSLRSSTGQLIQRGGAEDGTVCRKKRQQKRLNDDSNDNNFIFYWNRPLGSSQGTYRLTLEHKHSPNRKSYWAVAHPWKDILTVLLKDYDEDVSIDNLEIAGDGSAWANVGRNNWEEVCHELFGRRKIQSVTFLGGGSGSIQPQQQVTLLKCVQPQSIQFNYPKAYGDIMQQLLFLTQKGLCEKFEIHNGSALTTEDCKDLARLFSHHHHHHHHHGNGGGIRSLTITNTDIESYEAWKVVYDSMQASHSLETVTWKEFFTAAVPFPSTTATSTTTADVHDDDNNNNNNRQEKLSPYLDGKHQLNVLRRVLTENVVEQQSISISSLSKKKDDDHRLETIDSAVNVVHEWWRSTHRPPEFVSTSSTSSTNGGKDDSRTVSATTTTEVTGIGSISTRSSPPPLRATTTRAQEEVVLPAPNNTQSNNTLRHRNSDRPYICPRRRYSFVPRPPISRVLPPQPAAGLLGSTS